MVVLQMEMMEEVKIDLMYEKLLDLKTEAHKATAEIRKTIEEHAKEYYGGTLQEYFKKTEREYETEDGFVVSLKEYKITITKEVEVGVIVADGTRYDKECCDLCFSISSLKGRKLDGYGKKYEQIRSRMVDIWKSERVLNPFAKYNEVSFYI